MKKSSFVALVLGTLSGLLFSLGMCMALLAEWNAFTEGVILGSAGVVLGVVALIVWCKMEKRKMPELSGKNILRAAYGVFAALVFGIGMCMCLVWHLIVWGTLVGLLGIVMLVTLVPIIKGIR